MLKQTIAQCPASIWDATGDRNRFWQVAYHALYFTHEYLADSEETFVPWVKRWGLVGEPPALDPDFEFHFRRLIPDISEAVFIPEIAYLLQSSRQR